MLNQNALDLFSCLFLVITYAAKLAKIENIPSVRNAKHLSIVPGFAWDGALETTEPDLLELIITDRDMFLFFLKNCANVRSQTGQGAADRIHGLLAVPDETASTAVLVGFHRDVTGYSLCLMLLSENVLWWGIDGSVINLVC